MATFALAFVVMAIVMAIMAVGMIVKKKPIKGTCASLSNLGANGECIVCGKKPDSSENETCNENSPQALKKNLYYVADAPQKRIP